MNRLPLLLLSMVLLLGNCSKPKTISISDEIKLPTTQFAVKDLINALAESDYQLVEKGTYQIEIKLDERLQAQAYTIQKSGNRITVSAGDESGAMYGTLDLAEQLKILGNPNKIKEKSESPFIEHRGIKMNIALDGRLPSYDDTGDAAQKNIAEMWNMDFWTEYLDDLARHRYNTLTFWSKHPFPALCELKDYPGAAMEDVYAYNKAITWETHRDWNGINIQDMANLRKIKSMTIQEKIAFWQQVMEHAHNRGIEIMWFTWNIFISPGTGEITNPESEEALVYMRKAVQEMVETYPYLAGFGVTAGERMDMTVGPYSAPGWMFETYGKGIIEAKKNNPDRPFRFIFRRHHAFLETIQNDFASKFPGEVQTSYKYNVSRMYSTPRPPIFEREYLPDVRKYDFKCWMNVRNDDMFTFRWGDPDFVRAYLKRMMSFGVVPGFYMGSDGYLWGREFTSKNPKLSGELEIKKHWYRYFLWGRLAYNPDVSDKHLQSVIKTHFPESEEEDLFNAWRYASKIVPLVSNFHWKPADAMWAVEGCMDQYEGFQNLRDFIDCYTLEDDRLQNITDYVNDVKANRSSNLKSPLQTADSLRLCSQKTLKYLEDLKAIDNKSDAFQATLYDIECFALYGEYYAGKISAATYLHLYENLSTANKEDYKTKALEEANKALKAWEKLAEIADSQYKVQLLARTRKLDWVKTIEDVKQDIEIIKSSTGQEPKVAKVFYSGHAKIEKAQRIKLAKFLESKGYVVEEYAGWKTEAYASGLKIAFAVEDGLISQFYTSWGGTYPPEYKKTGILIGEVHDKTWVIGKDIEHTNKSVDVLISRLEKELE